MKDGKCPYIQKAQSTTKAGGVLSIVYLTTDKDPLTVFPFQGKMASDNAAPLIVISQADGEEIVTALN
jgi:hypothetical protein